MDIVLKSPQIHSTFSNLGFMHGDEYHVNENCNAALETILHNILIEDEYLRTHRRSISFGQNIKKDLIPLLIHAKDDKTIELLVTILVNLSIPIECLLSVEETSQSDFGLQTVFEINQLLTAIKEAFTGPQATKVVVDFLKKNIVGDQPKVSPEQCTNISNSLLLLRNILHIPEDVKIPSAGNNGPDPSVQNQVIGNIFSQSIDKVLIKLMTIPEAANWAVTMVQFIALLYKDQRVITLHKLLNSWLESCNSESSEDDENNTSPSDRGSEDSSPMLTSYSWSDSSYTGGSRKSNDEPNSENNEWKAWSENKTMENDQSCQPRFPDEKDIHKIDQDASTGDENMKSNNDNKVVSEGSLPPTTTDQQPEKTEKKAVVSETFDCGYETKIENQESVSTSSNDDDLPSKKPVHQKPHNPKQRANTKVRTDISLQEKKFKKIVKRGRANIINLRGFTGQPPTDNDISNVLKEFTVDFLLKGYNSLVQTLHSQLLNNVLLEIDTSHFFWLVTYFMKFATQIKLDLEHISAVLSFDIVSYFTAEGVNLCEQFELAVKLNENDLKPSSRRLHLVVTAIREFIQAVEAFKQFPHICAADKDALLTLENKVCETDELRSLLVLLLRHYNPKYHTKQYLQDLIVTNHIFLNFVDSATRNPNYTGSTNIADHIKQFATPKIMYQYGLLLEDYKVNGVFINDCVFTVMHHVAGISDSLIIFCHPKIMKTFASILKSEFEICDDWYDLVQHVINTSTKKQHERLNINNDKLIVMKLFTDLPSVSALVKGDSRAAPEMEKKMSAHSSTTQSSNERWSENEPSSLSWIYLQCNTLPDVVGEMLKRLKEDGKIKSRISLIRELYKQNIINKEEFEKLSKAEVETESDRDSKMTQRNKEIGKLCQQLRRDGKAKYLDWVQQVLLDTCYAKLLIKKRNRYECVNAGDQSNILQFKLFNHEFSSHVMSPVSYHALLLNRSIPLVPWNCEQAAMCKDLKFLQLLHRLDFQMPVDTGKLFIRIPHGWPADVLYELAGRVAVIDTTKLQFFISDLTSSSSNSNPQQSNSALPTDLAKDDTSLISAPENFCQIHERTHITTTVNVPTLSTGSSFKSDIENKALKRCSLEMVQQSQNTKLTCTVESKLLDKVPLPPTEAALAPAPDLPECKCQQDFTVQLVQSDDDSISEAGSAVSELSRMYFSDEDDKFGFPFRPSVKAKAIVEERVSDSDTEASACKRRRGCSITF